MKIQKRVRHTKQSLPSTFKKKPWSVLVTIFVLTAVTAGMFVWPRSNAAVEGCTLSGPRDAACWPFSVDSPLNMPLGSGAQYAGTGDAATAAVLRDGARTNANEGYSHPVYQGKTSDPWTTFNDTSIPSRSRSVNTPSSATPASGTDGHMHVITPDKRYVHENWIARRTSATSFSTRRHEVTDLHGTGIGVGGTRAWGGSALGGLVRIHEVQERKIPHAIALGMNPDQMKAGPVWPATAQDGDGSGYSGTIPMGTMFAIPPSVNINNLGLNADALALAKALQDYGGYVTDQAAPTVFYLEQGSDPARVANINAQVVAIKNQLRRVTNISQSGWNSWRSSGQGMGGGTPRTTFAPPIGQSSGPVDPSPTNVGFTAPVAGATVSGAAVNLSATAQDNTAITKVEFFDGDTKIGNGVRTSGTNANGVWSLAWNTSQAGNGTHALRVMACDATPTCLENTRTVSVTGSFNIVRVNNNTTGTNVHQFAYAGNWQYYTNGSRDDHYSNSPDDTATFKFSGNKIKLFGNTDVGHGIAAISVDGGPEVAVDTYSTGFQEGQLIFERDGLTTGPHMIRVRVTGNKQSAATNTFISLDRAESITETGTVTPPPSSDVLLTINDNTTGTGLNQFEYNGIWGYSQGASNDDHWSNTADSTATLRFSGTQVKLFGNKSSNTGFAAISIDGGPETTVDTYAASTEVAANIYTSPMLTNGNHTVRIRVTGEKNSSSSDYTLSVDKAEVAMSSTKPGDANGDGSVNGLDLSVVLSNYGKSGQTRVQGDLDGTGTVNGLDLSQVLANYGK